MLSKGKIQKHVNNSRIRTPSPREQEPNYDKESIDPPLNRE